MTAVVDGVSAASTVWAVRLPVSGSTSAKTGLAPTYVGALVVAMNENEGTITSLPVGTSATTSARCSAVVQLDTATPCGACMCPAKADSNSATLGPWATHPDRTTSATAAASSSPSHGFMTLMRSLTR